MRGWVCGSRSGFCVVYLLIITLIMLIIIILNFLQACLQVGIFVLLIFEDIFVLCCCVCFMKQKTHRSAQKRLRALLRW